MLKIVKALTGTCILVAMVLPGAAQQLTVTREAPPQAAPKKADLRPKYLVVRGRVLMRTDKNGATRYGYENGRLVKEIQPNDVVGTYQYDSGKFTGVVYTDGRYIKASYAPNGALVGLTTDTSARVRFSVKNKPTRVGSFAAIQNGIAALRNPTSNYCVGTDDDATCTIIVEDTLPPADWGGGGGGGGGGGSGYLDELPSGEGEGAIQNPPNETPAECKENVCKPVNRTLLQYCMLATNGPVTLKKCIDKAGEYYQRCQSSCETNDWSWLNWWAFFY
jgi:hypothetical protein